jgi:hypothetical protein
LPPPPELLELELLTELELLVTLELLAMLELLAALELLTMAPPALEDESVITLEEKPPLLIPDELDLSVKDELLALFSRLEEEKEEEMPASGG